MADLMPNYCEPAFWDSRYESGPAHTQGVFEWFPSSGGDDDPVMRALHERGVPKTGRILDNGCGNSKLPFQLLDNGYKRVVAVDFSAVVIDQMRQQSLDGMLAARNPHQEEIPKETNAASAREGAWTGGTLHFFAMDSTQLAFSDDSFDAVVDKGLMDSVLANYDRVTLFRRLQPTKEPEALRLQQAEDSLAAAGKVLSEVQRILKPGGVYLSVSFEDPGPRLPIISGHVHPGLIAPWEVSHSKFDDEKNSQLYACVKGQVKSRG